MPRIRSFEEWSFKVGLHKQATAIAKGEENITCPICNGSGEAGCGCYSSCCKGEKECEGCDGLGEIPIGDAPYILLARSDYFDAVIAELRLWSVYTKEDFLGVVGPFVREFRRNSQVNIKH